MFRWFVRISSRVLRVRKNPLVLWPILCKLNPMRLDWRSSSIAPRSWIIIRRDIRTQRTLCIRNLHTLTRPMVEFALCSIFTYIQRCSIRWVIKGPSPHNPSSHWFFNHTPALLNKSLSIPEVCALSLPTIWTSVWYRVVYYYARCASYDLGNNLNYSPYSNDVEIKPTILHYYVTLFFPLWLIFFLRQDTLIIYSISYSSHSQTSSHLFGDWEEKH